MVEQTKHGIIEKLKRVQKGEFYVKSNRCPGYSRYCYSTPFSLWIGLGSGVIQRKKQPFQDMWALPGGHLTNEDSSLEAAARRETWEETGLDIPLHLFQQVHTFEDFEDPRGKYVCLLYVLSEPLSPEAKIEAGDDASHVQWYSVENLQNLPDLAFNHIRLLRMALRQMFTSYYHDALDLQEINACQCEMEIVPGQQGCPNTAYWSYNDIAICPKDSRL